jgi:hypothetical protein
MWMKQSLVCAARMNPVQVKPIVLPPAPEPIDEWWVVVDEQTLPDAFVPEKFRQGRLYFEKLCY